MAATTTKCTHVLKKSSGSVSRVSESRSGSGIKPNSEVVDVLGCATKDGEETAMFLGATNALVDRSKQAVTSRKESMDFIIMVVVVLCVVSNANLRREDVYRYVM
jgi:hypothetical protein